MLDFRDLLDGVDVTKNTPSDEDVGGDANDQTRETGRFLFSAGFFFLVTRFSGKNARRVFFGTTATDATDATDALTHERTRTLRTHSHFHSRHFHAGTF